MKHILLLSLFLVRAASAAEPVMSATECQVWERERSFAQSVANHDKQAFAEHVYEDAVFSAATDHTQRGRDTIVAKWNDIIEGKKVNLEWRPQYVSIAADSNVAMSRGPYVFSGKDDKGVTKYAIGDFVSVWVRKDAASPWQVALDGGGPPPKEATEEEARQHLAQAPAACLRSP
ncbi:MAG TPA: nuclear transport factor 2 family protein [Steroidobacteraceae bacterium]|nr:nuclear transport factor 2 family protein [Steroidobacteraceae bacterium]